LRRSLGTRTLGHLDPFLLFDEFRSDQPDDYIAGFPDHPHRGFETVTYMLAGRLEHADHAGNRGNLVAGSIQWMTAGRGIVHSEMPRQDDGLLWGFQLWINLPASLKMSPPRYQDIPPDDVPVAGVDGATIRVLAGEAGGVKGPVEGIVTEPVYLDISMGPAASLTQDLPRGHSAFVYTVDGTAIVGGHGPETSGARVESGRLAVLGPGDAVRIESAGEAIRLLLVAARPIGEPIARYGPFVMNTQEELRQAFEDLERGTFLT
jgi:hypothetical protein